MLFGGAVACALPVLRESSRKWLLIPGTILGGLIAGGVSVEMLWTCLLYTSEFWQLYIYVLRITHRESEGDAGGKRTVDQHAADSIRTLYG